MRHIELFIIGIFVHIVLLFAIFDVYYKSPISHGINPVKIPSANPPARRLVLFVADGLRAQSFFEPDPFTGKRLAPFLRNVIETKGSWGVSHTRVPTESRPGHVALIAGFYEDVSAVAKGWKENPVEFDSVFNQSRFTWSWGSPDILPMFSKGASAGHVFTLMYPGESEDFASEDASRLDTWVFDSVENFLSNAKSNETLTKMLNEEGLVFFLHLLGLDTNGHGNKPRSKEYIENINLVDKGVEHISELISSFFNDGKTAFLFTADHGMTDWGSHGAGDNEETMTPLVAWGAGISGPSRKKIGDGNIHSDEKVLWGLSDLERKDVAQADVAPLMSSLIGIPIPVNSVGRLPISYLNSSEKYLYAAAFANFQQIVLQFKEKKADKAKHSFRFFFREFAQLRPKKVEFLESEIGRLAGQRRFKPATELCLESIPDLLAGVQFYHQYERGFLTLGIVGIFLGWMCLVWITVKSSTNAIEKSAGWKKSLSSVYSPSKICGGTMSVIVLCLYLQSLPMSYYLYCCVPVYLANLAWNARIHKKRKETLINIVSEISIVILAGSVIFFAFFYRWALSIGLVIFSVFPFVSEYKANSRNLKLLWSVLCLLNAVFPLLPTVGQASDIWIVVLAPIGSVICLGLFLLKQNLDRRRTRKNLNGPKLFDADSAIVVWLTICLALSTLVLMATEANISAKMGLPILCQGWSYCTLVSAPILPLFGSNCLEFRILAISLSFFVLYTLMSVAYESLFFVAFCCLLLVWLKMEMGSHSHDTSFKQLNFGIVEFGSEGGKKKRIELNDWRLAFFFLFFVLLSFFGTGNIASLNSFNPSFTRCFSTVFRPFLMCGLMVLKILIPFLLVSVSLCALEQITGRKAKDLMLLILIYSDFTAMLFFFLLKDEGSWLEIGTSISHYAISMLITIFLLILYQLAAVITRIRLNDLFGDKSHIL